MNFNKFSLRKSIKTNKNSDELLTCLRRFKSSETVILDDIIVIKYQVFYNFTCDLNDSEVEITAKFKDYILVFCILFFFVFMFGMIQNVGFAFGIICPLVFFFFGYYVHKKMMESIIDEISEFIK